MSTDRITPREVLSEIYISLESTRMATLVGIAAGDAIVSKMMLPIQARLGLLTSIVALAICLFISSIAEDVDPRGHSRWAPIVYVIRYTSSATISAAVWIAQTCGKSTVSTWYQDGSLSTISMGGPVLTAVATFTLMFHWRYLLIPAPLRFQLAALDSLDTTKQD
jgi:hypothetical protein